MYFIGLRRIGCNNFKRKGPILVGAKTGIFRFKMDIFVYGFLNNNNS